MRAPRMHGVSLTCQPEESPRYWCRRPALPCVRLRESRQPEPLPSPAVTFESLPDHELQQLADEPLIAYIRDSRAEGDLAAARRGLAILVYGYERDVKRRLSLRVPAHVVDDVDAPAVIVAVPRSDGQPRAEDWRLWEEMRARLSVTRSELIDLVVVGEQSWWAAVGAS